MCHYSLIITQFRDRYIQVNNEIVDSGSLKGDRVLYIQVTAIYRAVIYRFDCMVCKIYFVLVSSKCWI